MNPDRYNIILIKQPNNIKIYYNILKYNIQIYITI